MCHVCKTKTSLDDYITLSKFINFNLIVYHLLIAAENHQPVAMDKTILEQTKINIESGKYSDDFEAFLCAFDEWMQK